MAKKTAPPKLPENRLQYESFSRVEIAIMIAGFIFSILMVFAK